MSQKTKRKIARAEVGKAINDGILANDVLRVQGLQGLLSFRTKKANLQQREAIRLNAKYDNKHVRTKQANTRLDENASYISGLRMEITRATTKVEKPDDNGWVVQGHIYDKTGCPIANADVALYSTDEKKVTSVAPVKTDSKGFYKLGYTGTGGTKTGEAILEEAGTSILAQASGTEATGEEAAATGEPREGGPTTINTNVSNARLSSGLRINTNVSAKTSVFVRANMPNDTDICADSTLINPAAGSCSYRDIILNTTVFKQAPAKDRRATRFLGNSASRELHDLKNEQKRCQIDNIRFDNCVNFNTINEATKVGYDFCAYCFGKDKSKR